MPAVRRRTQLLCVGVAVLVSGVIIIPWNLISSRDHEWKTNIWTRIFQMKRIPLRIASMLSNTTIRNSGINTESSTFYKTSDTFECVDPHARLYGRPEDVFCSTGAEDYGNSSASTILSRERFVMKPDGVRLATVALASGKLPKFEPSLTNPCFYDYRTSKDKKRLRCIPYFYVIGMDKCGTTDIFQRLRQHPHIQGNSGVWNKEVQFWSWNLLGVRHRGYINRTRSLEQYVNYFQETADLIQRTNNTKLIVGDASPMYFYDFHGWDRIPQNWGLTFPRVLTPALIQRFHGSNQPKFVLQLRDPVKRLYSDFEFLNYGHSVADFHKAVVQAKDMMDHCLKTRSRFLCFNDLDLYLNLPEWLRVFPRQSFHITRIEDYHQDMAATLNSLFRFLDLDPLSKEQMKDILGLKVALQRKTTKEALYPETIALLKNFYQSCNLELAAMLNDDKFLWDYQ